MKRVINHCTYPGYESIYILTNVNAFNLMLTLANNSQNIRIREVRIIQNRSQQ